MATVKLNLCGQIFRILFFLLNFIFLIFGVVLIGFGAYLLATSQDLSFITDSKYASGAAIIVAVGCVTFIITVIGLIGAFGLYPIALGIYSSVVIIIIILEIVAAILGFVYHNEVEKTFEKQALEAIHRYAENGTIDEGANNAVNYIQNTFDCCGWNDYTDWFDTKFMNATDQFPKSCTCDVGVTDSDCIPDGSQHIWKNGCSNSTVNLFRRGLIAVGGIGIGFGVSEILGVLFACGMICFIQHAKTQYTVV